MKAALASAQREAKASFGDDRVLVEKFVQSPRHIEVQVFGDGKGNAVHLGERDCSLQRRHQKVLEEAPSPALTAKQRAEIGATCADAVARINYRGAGTIEFLYEDYRSRWQEGIKASKAMGLYRQQYCGCIYSEKERYHPSDKN